MLKKGLLIVLMTVTGMTMGCQEKPDSSDRLKESSEQESQQIADRMRKYVLTPMLFDASHLADQEKELLRTLIEAGRLVDEIYWRQTYHGNISLRDHLESTRGQDDPLRKFFFMQAGPYDRLDHDAPFMDVPPKPLTAGFYPPDLTKDEFEKWIADHPEDRNAFVSPYTVIRRQGDQLVAVPYREEYKEFIEPLAEKLRRAADLSDNPSLRTFLLSKAEAILTDQYFATDVDWIDMKNSAFDAVLGPFEVYEDKLNNLKAAYEASIEVVDMEESAKLDIYTRHLADLEGTLPLPDRYKNRVTGLTATFTIVRDIYRGGDIRVGYQPVATNLPNDPEVHSKKGTKKTFWKNALKARMDQIIAPIGRRLIAEDQVGHMTGQGLFEFVLMHEIAHGLGPRYVHGSKTPVNVALRDLYSWLEENKADVAGLHSLRILREKGIMDKDMRNEHYVSYLGSIFRTIRFGTGEAHGKAALVTLNFLMDRGGITFDPETGRYAVDFDTFDDVVVQLANELLLIEAEGDYGRAKRLEEKYAGTSELVRSSLMSLEDLPIDFVPMYEIKWE